MDDAFSRVLASIGVAVLDGDIHGACSHTGYRERTGAAGWDAHRRAALDLCDAGAAERCREFVGAAGGTVGHRNDQRIADSDRGRGFRVVGARGDRDRVPSDRRIDGRGTAAADGQMNGALSGAVRAVVLDGDIHAACSQTGHRDRTGAARSDVDRRVALDLRDAAVAERCGKVIAAVGRTVGHVDDQSTAYINRDGFFRAVAACRGDTDRGAVGRRTDGNGTGSRNGAVRCGSGGDRNRPFGNAGDLAGLIHRCLCRVAAGPGDVLVGRIARSNGRSQLNRLAGPNGCCCRRNRNAGDRHVCRLRSIILDEEIDRRRVRIRKAAGRVDMRTREDAGGAVQIIPIRA